MCPLFLLLTKGAAQVLLRWRPRSKKPSYLRCGRRIQDGVSQLQPSKLVYAAYDAIVALPPGSYSYTFKIDGEYHWSRRRRGRPKKMSSRRRRARCPLWNLDIRLDGHGLKDDGAWALAGAIRLVAAAL